MPPVTPNRQTQSCCIQDTTKQTLKPGWTCFPGGARGKDPAASAGDIRDAGSIPGSGRSPGKGNAYPLQYSCLENAMDRGAWRATVHGVAKSPTVKQQSTHSITRDGRSQHFPPKRAKSGRDRPSEVLLTNWVCSWTRG